MALFTPCPHWAVVVQLWLMKILGIDIGGSGIKGAPVDLDEGVLAADRLRIPTPATSTLPIVTPPTPPSDLHLPD